MDATTVANSKQVCIAIKKPINYTSNSSYQNHNKVKYFKKSNQFRKEFFHASWFNVLNTHQNRIHLFKLICKFIEYDKKTKLYKTTEILN